LFRAPEVAVGVRAARDYLASMRIGAISTPGVLARWFSARCPICGIGTVEPVVCAGCSADFLDADKHRCMRCAIPLPGSASVCGACLHRPPLFDATVALADYAPPIDGLVLALKFGHRLDLAPVLGALLAQRLRPLAESDPLFVPVPLSFERLAERGFNQALEIARTTAWQLNAPVDAGAVVRVRHAAPQATLSLDARKRNIRGAFLVRGDVRRQALIVVDDVMTSGSTLDEMARVLKAAGAQRVTNLVVARTP